VPGKVVDAVVGGWEQGLGNTITWKDPADGCGCSSTRYTIEVTREDGRTLLYNVPSTVHAVSSVEGGLVRSSRIWAATKFGAGEPRSWTARLGVPVPNANFVMVGDPGNASDTTGFGAVAESFQIMQYEFTNQQYTDFLNSVAQSDPYGLYNPNMYTEPGYNRGGITRNGSSGSYTYFVNPSDMGNKPVNWVSWFDAARVANWLMNGATSSSSTETGAYTLNGAKSGNAVAVNPGATVYIPTEDQWYKAAYYKGGSTNAGYWTYATQSDTAPTKVTADAMGNGRSSSGENLNGQGNYANYNLGADWNSQKGNVTSVGTNGGPSAYGAFDMNGNVEEWNDLTGTAGSSRGLRGGSWIDDFAFDLSSSDRITIDPSSEDNFIGFRLASPVAVPEPSTWVMGLAGIACGGWQMVRRRRAR